MKKPLLATLVLLALAAVPAWAQTAKPNFSGTWSIDLAKSDFGPAPPPESLVLVVVHKEPNIKVSSTQKTQGVEISNERNLTTDGKPNPNKLKVGDGTEQSVTSTSKWSGNKLLTSYSLEMQGTAIDVTDTWELSADGKVLTGMRDLKTNEGSFQVKTVYNKQ